MVQEPINSGRLYIPDVLHVPHPNAVDDEEWDYLISDIYDAITPTPPPGFRYGLL
jgi:hypothetical protein